MPPSMTIIAKWKRGFLELESSWILNASSNNNSNNNNKKIYRSLRTSKGSLILSWGSRTKEMTSGALTKRGAQPL